MLLDFRIPLNPQGKAVPKVTGQLGGSLPMSVIGGFFIEVSEVLLVGLRGPSMI